MTMNSIYPLFYSMLMFNDFSRQNTLYFFIITYSKKKKEINVINIKNKFGFTHSTSYVLNSSNVHIIK